MRRLAALLLLLAAAAPERALARDPTAGPATLVKDDLVGPEGLAFAADGTLIVGSTGGALLQLRRDGSSSVLVDLDARLAGITVLRDGRVLACAFGDGVVWGVTPAGAASVFASGLNAPNFVAETPSGRVLVSESFGGTISDITTGTPVPRATGLSFPNGLAVGRDGRLYVAETLLNRVVRMTLAADGSLGPPEVYATGLTFADGIAFDRPGNLWVVGGGALQVVVARTGVVITFPPDPLVNWPSNVAFGRGRGIKRRDLYLANFGPMLGDGTTVVRVRTNRAGLPVPPRR